MPHKIGNYGNGKGISQGSAQGAVTILLHVLATPATKAALTNHFATLGRMRNYAAGPEQKLSQWLPDLW